MKFLVAFFLGLTLTACTVDKGELGSEKNPVKIYFVPSVDAKVIEENSKIFKIWLEANTPYKYEISIPQSFIAVVEAFGSKRADVASINTFGYIIANEKYQAEARRARKRCDRTRSTAPMPRSRRRRRGR